MRRKPNKKSKRSVLENDCFCKSISKTSQNKNTSLGNFNKSGLKIRKIDVFGAKNSEKRLKIRFLGAAKP
jgi:hypothetical protein